MKNIAHPALLLRLFAVLLFYLPSFCAGPAFAQAAAEGAPRPLLILATQGVDPAIDTVRYNSIVHGVATDFSENVTPLLREKRYAPVTVIDQSLKFDKGQKLALHAVKNQARTVIIVSLVNEESDGDRRLNMQVEYLELEYTYDGDKITGVKPGFARNKSYPLASSRYGFNTQPMSEVSGNFLKFLATEGRPLP